MKRKRAKQTEKSNQDWCIGVNLPVCDSGSLEITVIIYVV